MKQPATPEQLFARLRDLAIATRTQEHEAVFTVAQSATLSDRRAGAHSKNLFLKDKKGRLFLVTAKDDTAIDLKRLHERLGASGRLSFGSAPLLLETLGVEPGSVTPFAALNDTLGRVTVVLDARLMAHVRLHFHPLRNTMTTEIAATDLVRFLEAVGHPPLVTALPQPSGENCAADAPAPS